MATKVSLCNLAISHCQSQGFIADFATDATPQGVLCRLHYDPVRQSTLEAHPWNFATRRQALAPLGETVPDWDFAYAWPAGALTARDILKDSPDDDPIPFEVALRENGEVRCILTDRANAVLRFTRDVEQPALFSPLFVQAFSWALAASIAPAFTTDRGVQQACLTISQNYINAARTADANEGEREEPREADWIRARL